MTMSQFESHPSQSALARAWVLIDRPVIRVSGPGGAETLESTGVLVGCVCLCVRACSLSQPLRPRVWHFSAHAHGSLSCSHTVTSAYLYLSALPPQFFSLNLPIWQINTQMYPILLVSSSSPMSPTSTPIFSSTFASSTFVDLLQVAVSLSLPARTFYLLISWRLLVHLWPVCCVNIFTRMLACMLAA